MTLKAFSGVFNERPDGKYEKGFTLIEVAITISIVAMLIITSLTILSFGEKSFFAIGKQNELQTLAYQITSNISAQVRKSAAIAEVQADHLTISDKGGNAITFLYDPLEKTLLQIDGAGSIKLLASGIKSLNFTANGKKGVQMLFELEQKDQKYRFATAIYRRY